MIKKRFLPFIFVKTNQSKRTWSVCKSPSLAAISARRNIPISWTPDERMKFSLPVAFEFNVEQDTLLCSECRLFIDFDWTTLHFPFWLDTWLDATDDLRFVILLITVLIFSEFQDVPNIRYTHIRIGSQMNEGFFGWMEPIHSVYYTHTQMTHTL